MNLRKLPKEIILICLVIGIVIACFSFVSVAQVRGPMNWDEGDYYRVTQHISTDVTTLNISDFWTHTNKQRVHPFLFSWLMSPLLWTGSTSLSGLLLGNHLILALFPLVVAWLLLLINPQLTRVEAICFALVFSTAPVTLEYASVFMPEFIGLLLLFSGLSLWSVALVRPTRRLVWFAGFILPAVFFLKFSLGIILLAAIAFGVFERLIRKERFPTGCVVPLFAPFTVLSLLWFLTPLSGKIRGFFAFASNRSPSDQISYLQNLITYLTVLRDMLVASPWLICWFVLGVLAALIAARTDRIVRFHLIALLVAVSGFVFHPYTVERLAIHMVPSVWIILVIGFDTLCKRYRAPSFQKLFSWSLVLLSVTTVMVNVQYGVRSLPDAIAGGISPVRTTNWWIHPEIEPVLLKISESVCHSDQVVWLVGETNELNPGAIEFGVRRICANTPKTLIHHVSYPGNSSRSMRDTITSEQANQVIETMLLKHSPDMLIVINVKPGSVMDNEDYRLWHQWETEIKSQLRHQKGIKRLSIETFDESGLWIEIYRPKRFNPLRLKKKGEVDL